MAFIRLHADSSPRPADDPWNWGVDKVVANLCDLSGPMLRGVDPLSIPDSAFLEKSLRENAVSGPTLLTELTHPVLRDDLGLRPLGHRTTIMHMIMDLRRQSTKYLHHLQKNNVMPYPSGYGQVLNMGQTPRFVPPFPGPPFQQISREASVVSENLPSPFFSVVHGHQPAGRALVQNCPAPTPQPQTLYEPSRSSIHGFELVSSDRQALQIQNIMGNEIQHVDGGSAATADDAVSTGSQRAQSSEGVGLLDPQNSRVDSEVQKVHCLPSDIGREGETVIIDENGKKRRRLILTPVKPGGIPSELISPAAEGSPVSLASREKDSTPEVEAGSENQTSNYEPMEQSGPSTPMENRALEPNEPEPIITTPPKDNDRAGTVFIDEQGRKRLKPVLLARTELENSAIAVEDALENSTGLTVQLPTPSSETSNFKPSTRQNRVPKSRHTYLGVESLPIDKIFYSDTKIGQEVNNGPKSNENWQLNVAGNLENFAFAGTDFGNGQRCYVHSRIRHFLFSRNTRTVKRKGHILVVHVPYPDSFGKKHHQLSVTVYSRSTDRIIASRMDRSSFSGHEVKNQGGRVFVETVPGQPYTALLETDGDTNWDYLKKWDFKAGEGKVLPVYGDSGSENEYDLDTWREMEEEGGKMPRPLGPSKRKKIDSMATEHAISEAIEHIVEHWTRVKKPKLLVKAWRIWTKAKKDRTVFDQISALTRDVEHLETRLSNIQKEILREDWSSAKDVIKQCRSMEESIFDREACNWRVSILNLKAAPEKPSSVTRKPKKRKTESTQIPVQDSGEDIVSKDSASESSNDELDDFIDDEGIDEANVGHVNEDVAHAFGDPQVFRVSELSDVDADDASSESDDIQPEKVKSESLAAGPKKLAEARRKNIMDTLHKTRSNTNVEVIDLTQQSESSEVETRLERSSPVRTPPLDPALNEDPFGRSRAKPALFKHPPMASSIVQIDSDSAEYSTAREDISTSPSSLPEFAEVKKIARLSWEMLVERKDRKRLLIWIVHHCQPQIRDRIIDFNNKQSFEDIQEVVWAAFKALFGPSPKIIGIDKEESNAWMLLATWYISWTIPVKIQWLAGIQLPHVRTAQKDHKGFLPFYEFLNKCLAYYEPERSTNTAVPNSKGRKSKKPKKQKLREGSDENLERTPHKKRKFAVPESQATINLRLKAHERVREETMRTKNQNLELRFQEMGTNEEDSSMAVVNPGKLDDQAFIYINPKISGKMQAHQKEGVQFMWREVVTDHQGCLLAQTMGLGKTMQVITLLVTIAEAARSPDENVRNQVPKELHQSRTLILCPPALVENWWEEFVMWTPSSSAAALGKVRKVTADIKLQERLYEIERWKDDGGVLLIGFNTFRTLALNTAIRSGKRILDIDQHEMAEDALLNRPNLIVADEAHCAKSLTTGLNQAIRRLKSMNRIALTGSPLANNLEEYHSLIDWIAPNYLGTRVEFKANYGERIQEGLYQDSTSSQYRESLKLLEVLKTELQPKVHRADITVLRGIQQKEKQEFVIWVPLTQLQKQVYKIYVDLMLSVGKTDAPQSATMWAWLDTLRLLCNHPKCFKNKLLQKDSADGKKRRTLKKKNEDALEENDRLIDAPVSAIGISQRMVEMQLAPFKASAEPHDSIALSNKMQVLMDIIQFSREIRDKVLVFSHSIHTLNYVQDKMKENIIEFSRIDGMVPPTSRQNITKEFNSGSIEVCLISTRAGGQGLNLFGANRVIILDDHFNPMFQEQAIGRAYRIGQQKAVFVYHLNAGGTFEELLHNQSVFKQQLARRVVDKKNPARYAVRKIGEYLFHPKKVEQKDLGRFRGKDPGVLDRILNEHEAYV